MKELNVPRLLWAGFLAGLILVAGESILNGVLLGPEWTEVSYELDLVVGPAAGIALLAITLLLGFFLAWLTVTLHRRTQSAVVSVLEAALTIWLTVFLYTCIWLGLIGVFPWRLMVFGIVWGLGECVLAALAASWIYRR